MIQDISPHRLDNAFIPGREPSPDSAVWCFRGEEVLLSEDGAAPRCRDLPGTPVRWLFRLDGGDVFSASAEPEAPAGFAWRSRRALRGIGLLPPEASFSLYTALHLEQWYRRAAFCGACGAPTHHHDTERATVCTACGSVFYPRINPAVIVAVTDHGRLLQTRYAGRAFSQWALVAGFTEIGETLEETVRREVMEEVGLRVRNVRYYKSQPWGVAADILAGFVCEVDGPADIRLDRRELKEAAWHAPEEVVLQSDTWSLTNEMMTRFRDGDPFFRPGGGQGTEAAQ